MPFVGLNFESTLYTSSISASLNKKLGALNILGRVEFFRYSLCKNCNKNGNKYIKKNR